MEEGDWREIVTRRAELFSRFLEFCVYCVHGRRLLSPARSRVPFYRAKPQARSVERWGFGRSPGH